MLSALGIEVEKPGAPAMMWYEPFMAGISKALQYGLYDLARLEKIILDNIAGDFFDLS